MGKQEFGRPLFWEILFLWLSQRILIYDHLKLIYILTNVMVDNKLLEAATKV